MPQFDITIKNDKIKFYKSIALLLILLNLAVFIFLLIAGVHFYESLVAVLLLALYLIYLLYDSKKNKSFFFINEIAFFVLAGSWMALQNYGIAFACALLGILYHLSLQKLSFVVSDNFIRKKNFPQKTYGWQELANVILRDNILTIDLKNNTLMQLEIEGNVNEIQFNEFARQQLLISANVPEKQL